MVESKKHLNLKGQIIKKNIKEELLLQKSSRHIKSSSQRKYRTLHITCIIKHERLNIKIKLVLVSVKISNGNHKNSQNLL